MSEFVVKVPDVGEGVAEAEIVAWHVQTGDAIEVDQAIVEVLTDKATVEIPSPVAGTVAWVSGDVGDVVAVGSDLVRIDRSGAGARRGEGDTAAPADVATPRDDTPAGDDTGEYDVPAARRVAAADDDTAELPAPAVRRPAAATTASPPGGAARHDVAGRPQAAPAVRKRALDAGVDLRQVAGSGPAGRVTHEDLDAHLAGGAGRRAGSPTPWSSTFAPVPDDVEDQPIRGVRRRIAAAVSDSATRIAHITYVDDVDLTALQSLRAQLNGSPDGTAGRPRLTLLPFLVRALVAAVREHPQFNARFDDTAGVLHKHRAVHVGIAAQTPNGLMVPVLRHAEGLDVFAAAAEIERLATAAREGTISAAELNGSTITISSLGALGGLMSTPIINGDEVAIVGVNKLEQRPVWNEQRQAFEPRQMMNLSSSFDHRIIDGWDAAQFVQHVKSSLQSPALLLI